MNSKLIIAVSALIVLLATLLPWTYNRLLNSWQTILPLIMEEPIWCNGSLSATLLQLDQACLLIQHEGENSTLDVWSQSSECYHCSLWKVSKLKPGLVTGLVVNTTYSSLLYLTSNQKGVCRFSQHFGEYGLYRVNVSEGSCSDLESLIPPANIYNPLLWMAMLFIISAIVWGFLCILRDRRMFWRWLRSNEVQRNDIQSASPTEVTPLVRPVGQPARQATQYRIRSLDAFRGLAVILMIFVNYGGGQYWIFRHAPWNGLTIADVVFPWFMWIMGASLILSMRSQLRRAQPRYKIFANVVRRSAILFGLGLVLNSDGNNHLPTLRVPGVLQRFGFAYFFVGSLETFLSYTEDTYRIQRCAWIRDLTAAWAQWIIVLLLVTCHTLVSLLLSVPGCPTGYLGPGGLHGLGAYSQCTGGAAGYVDKLIFGASHIYQRPTCRVVYGCSEPFDPEGSLGSFNSILVVYLGVQAGRILLTYQTGKQRVSRWITWGICCGLIGGALCGFSKEEGIIPVNKNLWSLSFVLVTSSTAFLVLAFLYVIIDECKLWSGAPLRYPGTNAIVLYVGHELTRDMFPWRWSPIPQTHAAHLFMNSLATVLWVIISFTLYRKKMFLSV